LLFGVFHNGRRMTSSSTDSTAPSETLRNIGTLAICLGTIAVPMDTAVNVAFPAIVAAFRRPIADIQWIAIFYALSHGALMLACGRAGDIIGHRVIFLLGCALSAISFILCAVAPSYPLLLTARVLQGAGAALTLSCGPALLTALHSEHRRVAMLGLYALAFGFGATLGPLIGGLLISVWDWPAAFLFRVPFVLVALALAWRLPLVTKRDAGGFDLTGAILLVSSCAALTFALDQLQHVGSLAFLAAAFIVFAILTAAFIMRQRRVAHPLIDLAYFRDAGFTLLNVGNAALNLSTFAVFLLMSFYLVQIARVTGPVSGVIIAALPFGAMVAAPIAARLAMIIRAKPLALLGAAIAAASTLLVIAGAIVSSITLIAVAAALQGFGAGLFQVAYFDIATATLPVENRGVAGSLVLMTRTLGLVIGATILTLTFQRVSTSAMLGGADSSAAFMAGFHAVFALATIISFAIVVWALVLGWARRR
jgi:MFS family permease